MALISTYKGQWPHSCMISGASGHTVARRAEPVATELHDEWGQQLHNNEKCRQLHNGMMSRASSHTVAFQAEA